jgi:hypothetical protein
VPNRDVIELIGRDFGIFAQVAGVGCVSLGVVLLFRVTLLATVAAGSAGPELTPALQKYSQSC